MSRPAPMTEAMVGLAAATLFAGCSVLGGSPRTEDALRAWSDRPLAPDPALAREALNSHSACLMDAPAAEVRILLEDRRTPETAAFLVATPTMFGACLITHGTGGSSGGGGPVPGPMPGAISIDANASGGSTDAQAHLLGGRVALGASQVVVALADGRAVLASLDNGYWLAWWPDTVSATNVRATDAGGGLVGTAEVVK